jgi:drug/metabolite transporter (DMT)-like permease
MRNPIRIDATHALGAAMALGAALLFGASAPFSKMLLRDIGPLTLAALVYIGAGLGLLPFLPRWRGRAAGARGVAETALKASDLPLLLAAILCGSILGPAFMMLGLQRLPAVTGSLLLNLEPPLTILIAVLWFREHLGWRQAGAAALILLGEVIVGYRPGELRAEWAGVLAVALASFSWAIDTNLNQRLSLRDPVALGALKGLIGGVLVLLIARAAGEGLPGARAAVWALLLGAVSYGASIVLFFRALRELGAARVAAYFATAPFVGALASVPVLGERLGGADLLAMAIMAAGLGMLLRETHDHGHAHEEMEHDHAHVHDEHHRHDHAPEQDASGSHAHPHRHAPLTHAHPHVPDLHHRHAHD